MYFMIDYENVRTAGMRGVEYLCPSDHVLLFYSGSVPNMQKRLLDAIKKSGCEFEAYKLVQIRKNGLDFYIGARLGEIFGQGCKDVAVIVSKDKGYEALIDYWAKRSPVRRRVILRDTIEKGIATANLGDQRTRFLFEQRNMTDIDTYFAEYRESLDLRKQLENAFVNAGFAEQTPEVEDILKNQEGSQNRVQRNASPFWAEGWLGNVPTD